MAARSRRFAVCLKNTGYEASLEPRKIYEVLPDQEAEKHRQLRVIDESGEEDYQYPESFFAAIRAPSACRKAVMSAV